MIYKLNNSELEQIARIYEMDSATLAERLQFEDDIISFLPYEGGVEIKTKNIESLILRFKDQTLNMGGGA